MQLIIATTLSMLMTFALHCTLKNTRADGFFLQSTFIDVIQDRFLHFRCFLANIKKSKSTKDISSRLNNIVLVNQNTCDYIITSDEYEDVRPFILIFICQKTLQLLFGLVKTVYDTLPVVYVVFSGWLMGRFLDSFALWCQVDVFTVYFLICQFMFVIVQWEYEQLPFVSITFYQGWLCLLMAFNAFLFYDIMFKFLPSPFKFCFFWIFSVKDM